MIIFATDISSNSNGSRQNFQESDNESHFAAARIFPPIKSFSLTFTTKSRILQPDVSLSIYLITSICLNETKFSDMLVLIKSEAQNYTNIK